MAGNDTNLSLDEGRLFFFSLDLGGLGFLYSRHSVERGHLRSQLGGALGGGILELDGLGFGSGECLLGSLDLGVDDWEERLGVIGSCTQTSFS